MDFFQYLLQLQSQGRGVAFILIPISRHLLEHFPSPQSPVIESFFNFSDDPESELADVKTFNPALHLFHLTQDNILMFAAVGQSPGIYEWAQEWVSLLSQDPLYSSIFRHVIIKTESDFLDSDQNLDQNLDPFSATPFAFTDDEKELNYQDYINDTTFPDSIA